MWICTFTYTESKNKSKKEQRFNNCPQGHEGQGVTASSTGYFSNEEFFFKMLRNKPLAGDAFYSI